MSAETFMGIRIKATESILWLVLITDPVIGMGDSVYEVEVSCSLTPSVHEFARFGPNLPYSPALTQP